MRRTSSVLGAIAAALAVVFGLGAGTSAADSNGGDEASQFLSCRIPLELGGEEEGDTEAADATDSVAAPRETTNALTLIDCANFKLLAKSLQQKDDSGDSRFGVGLDWKYAFEKTWEGPFSPTLGFNGEGFVSLNDPNSSRGSASDTANGDSILNQIRFTAKGVHTPRQERYVAGPPPPKPEDGDDAALASWEQAMEEWKNGASVHVKEVAYRQATGYTALDVGIQVRSESSQDFDDNQFAVGVGATAASGWVAQYLLYPLRFLVPQRSEYGDVVQSPLVFFGFDEVLGANHRSSMDGASDDDYERLRLEVAWTTELLIDGLYPFVGFHLLHELGASSATKSANKATTTFLEVGADFYIGDQFEAVRQFFGGSGGPFLGFKYTTGRLPPYLEKDHQASVGLGFEF